MSWLPQYPQGRVPADYLAGARVDVGSMPHIQGGNPLLAAFQKIAPEILAYIKKKKNDAIANQLLQMEGGEFQGQGAEGLSAAKMYQDFQARQAANEPDTAMDDLQYQRGYRQTHPEEFQQSAGRQYVQTPHGNMTAGQWAKMQQQEDTASKKSVSGLSDAQLDEPGLVRYEDKSGNALSTEQADADPNNAFANPPGNNNLQPYTQWRAAVAAVRKQQGAQSHPQVPEKGLATAPMVGQTPQDQGSQVKQLDATTARTILQEAGGDKEKARAIATQRGFTF